MHCCCNSVNITLLVCLCHYTCTNESDHWERGWTSIQTSPTLSYCIIRTNPSRLLTVARWRMGLLWRSCSILHSFTNTPYSRADDVSTECMIANGSSSSSTNRSIRPITSQHMQTFLICFVCCVVYVVLAIVASLFQFGRGCIHFGLRLTHHFGDIHSRQSSLHEYKRKTR